MISKHGEAAKKPNLSYHWTKVSDGNFFLLFLHMDLITFYDHFPIKKAELHWNILFPFHQFNE